MIFSKKIAVVIFISFVLSACATSHDQTAGLIDNQNNLDLCSSYLSEFDLLFSDEVASLNEQKRLYLIDLLHEVNMRGLTKPICQRMIEDGS